MLVNPVQAGEALSPNQLKRQSISESSYDYVISSFDTSFAGIITLTLDKKPYGYSGELAYPLFQACRTAFEYKDLLVLHVYVQDEDGLVEDIFDWDCLSQVKTWEGIRKK